MLDLEIAAGNIDLNQIPHPIFGGNWKPCLGDQGQGCFEIVRIAKRAVDAIVIA
jgi:hypothetical protein